jgi:hypothetical protein
MICPAIRTVLMSAFTLLTLAGGLRAHIPDKLVIDLELGEDWWEASSEMDVKFAVVALLHHYLPPDTGSGWIENLNTGQLELVRDLTEKLYRERFQFAIGGERVEMEVGFPDYGNPPLKFGLGENEEPVVRVVMRGPLPRERGAMTVTWNARWGLPLALMMREAGETTGPVFLAELGETVELSAGEESAKVGPRGVLGWVREGFLHLLPLGPVAGFHLGVELGLVAVLGAAILLALPFLWKGAFARMRVSGTLLDLSAPLLENC